MKLFDKMKNLFTEEIEEEPIKSEVMQVEIPAPTRKEEVDITDNQTIKSEEKVSTPIFFDDEYFKELDQPKKEVKSSYLKETKKEEKKIFKPTPIISPVYGVLDKNYCKEDITNKSDKPTPLSLDALMTIDDVRKKAFGTLEDELETTLFGNNSILFNDVAENKTNDLFEELTEDDELLDFDILDDEEVKEEPIKDSELFNLIDSMYEKGQ
ncbi:MAG: hypothetical protein RSB71_02950 [Bacilli bacterium]